MTPDTDDGPPLRTPPRLVVIIAAAQTGLALIAGWLLSQPAVPGWAIALSIVFAACLISVLTLRLVSRSLRTSAQPRALQHNLSNQRSDPQRTLIEALLRSMEGGVVLLDLEQRVDTLNRNAESILGVTDAQARGRLIQEIARIPELHRLIATPAPIAQTDEFIIEGQPPKHIRATRADLTGENGQRIGSLIVLSDVTEWRRLESMRTDFAANVSHELRTPITNIKGYSETLLELDLRTHPEEAAGFLRVIAASADRLGAIVEDMLMLTRLERPDAADTLERIPTRLAPIIDAVRLALDLNAREKSITLRVEVPDDLAADANPQLIEQALSNLVDNAIRYSPAGLPVTIRAAKAPHGTTIEVEDRGPGIAPEHLERIFERFYRVDKARTRNKGGTGLGLAIVKHIVNLHGGHITVHSTLGQGSTFKIFLPSSEHFPSIVS